MDKMRAMSTPPTKVSFKEQMHLAREEAILQATCRLLGEKAYDAMTMDDVANAVGIAKASLYKHFSSKEELCSAAMVQILARVRTYLDGLAAEMPPVEKLQALVRWSLERLITNEMPLLPSRNSSLRAVLMANKDYLNGLVTVSDQIGEWIVQAQAQGLRIQPRGIAGHHPGRFQALDPAQAGRGRQVHPFRQVRIGDAALALQHGKDAAVGGVELHFWHEWAF